MINYEDIDAVVDEIFLEMIKRKIFKPLVEENLVIVNADSLRNILRVLVEAKYYQRISEDSADKDKMADLQILLWQIKQEKEK